jgi:hypothetical protein
MEKFVLTYCPKFTPWTVLNFRSRTSAALKIGLAHRIHKDDIRIGLDNILHKVDCSDCVEKSCGK